MFQTEESRAEYPDRGRLNIKNSLFYRINKTDNSRLSVIRLFAARSLTFVVNNVML